jgi:DNA gyrase/topoisomerase IV subunit A
MTKDTSPFKITIILGDESPVAQIENIERILDDDGGLIASKVLPAETLAMPLSEEIIGSLNSSLLEQVEPLTTERDTLNGQVETLTGEKESLQSQLETATARADSLEDQLTETKAQLATAQGEASSVPNLQAQLDTANARIAELEAVPEEPVIVGVSKLTIMRRLGDKWPTLKAALSTLPESVQDAWLLAQEIRADDELIMTYGDTLKGLLDITDEEFSALLTP